MSNIFLEYSVGQRILEEVCFNSEHLGVGSLDSLWQRHVRAWRVPPRHRHHHCKPRRQDRHPARIYPREQDHLRKPEDFGPLEEDSMRRHIS